MAFRLDSILNPSSPAPESKDSAAQGSFLFFKEGDHGNKLADTITASVASTYEAAATLTALSSAAPSAFPSAYQFSSAQSGARPYHSPTNSYGSDGRPGSGYANHATPLEPFPPQERVPPPVSTGLQQYHHGSKSPEEQRRESFSYQVDPATQLPPIHSLAQYGDRPTSASEDRSAAYGHDTSRMAMGDVSTDINYIAQHREPDYERDVPTTSRVRQPSPLKRSSDHEPQQAPTDRPSSSTPHIKDEHANSPSTQLEAPNVDADTAKAILAAANEHGTRGIRAKPSTEQLTESEPAPTKKKAPTAKVGTKKGIARKPAPKKRKLENEQGRSMSPIAAASKAGASFRGGSGPPGKTSQSNTPHFAASSPTPTPYETSPPPDDEEEADEGSDNELYCICRKPDNHSWMIACDGGCDDWFHGKCVRMKEEQGELIDKYICPNCHRNGKGVTTWKPGCRRDGCNKPAEIRKDKQSKYCSDECGRDFMREKLGLDERPSKKQKRKGNHDGMDVDEEEDLGPHGGPLRPGDVKAMLDASKNVDDFRALGDGVLSPPATVSPERTTADAGARNGTDGDAATKPVSEAPLPQPPSYTLTPQETRRIQDISNEQDTLTSKKVMLRDREKFVKMVVDQANRYADKQGVKPKDVCGYDSRLAWSDSEFQRWRESKKGKDALRRSNLEAVPLTNGVDSKDEDTKAEANGDDVTMHEDKPSNDTADQSAEGSFCTKKRCEQHRQWQKNELTGVRAELVDLSEDANKLTKEEREMREQAFRRWKGEEGAKKNSTKGKGADHADQRADGWVEVV